MRIGNTWKNFLYLLEASNNNWSGENFHQKYIALSTFCAAKGLYALQKFEGME